MNQVLTSSPIICDLLFSICIDKAHLLTTLQHYNWPSSSSININTYNLENLKIILNTQDIHIVDELSSALIRMLCMHTSFNTTNYDVYNYKYSYKHKYKNNINPKLEQYLHILFSNTRNWPYIIALIHVYYRTIGNRSVEYFQGILDRICVLLISP